MPTITVLHRGKTNICWGVRPEYLTARITNLPPGTLKVRTRFRPNNVGWVFVFTEQGISRYRLETTADPSVLSVGDLMGALTKPKAVSPAPATFDPCQEKLASVTYRGYCAALNWSDQRPQRAWHKLTTGEKLGWLAAAHAAQNNKNSSCPEPDTQSMLPL